ncbi:MAG TPA: DUF4412 domain-containing protein [Candidatus Binataceae bacterium]|nr:DUF4412 domain-containing protein [Candidatus Binataceae bacterium]
MKKQFAIGLLGFTMLSGIAWAGVVVEEQQVTDRGAGAPINHKITVYVQGNKQKSVIDDGQQWLITDLDAGTRTVVYTARKSYMDMPFPPKGMPNSPNQTGLTFKKTGAHEKLIGYECDDYTGTGKLPSGDITVNGCFSTSAPGASNFTTFQKTMSDKVKGTPMALMSTAPEGIPLKIETTMKMSAMPQMANRPPIVTKMTVSKVTEENLSVDTFTPPKDYTKQQTPMMGMMPGHGPMMAPGHGPMGSPQAMKPGNPPHITMPGASPAAAPTKVPE